MLGVVLSDPRLPGGAKPDEALKAFGEVFPTAPPACTVTRMQQSGGNAVEIECIAGL